LEGNNAHFSHQIPVIFKIFHKNRVTFSALPGLTVDFGHCIGQDPAPSIINVNPIFMKISRLILATLPIIAVVIFQTPNRAQTALLPGDVALTGVNMDNPDEFTVVFMVDILAGTEIRFTDNGWKADGTFRTGEGIEIWVASQDYPAGEELLIVPVNMALASSGDQILVYQGTEEAPLFVAALNDEGEHVWQEDAVDASTSALPAGLESGNTCVALEETDNIMYNRITTTGTQEDLLVSINDYLNWAGSNTNRQVLSTEGFTVLDTEAVPFKLNIVSVNGGNDPYVNVPFDVFLQSVDSTGSPCPVEAETVVALSLTGGTGILSGDVQDTLPAGQSILVMAGLTCNLAENGLSIIGDALLGEPLLPDTSDPFNVVALPRIVINEILYNSQETGTDSSEFVELVNAGDDTVDMDGFSFAQGITFTFQGTCNILPGEHILVAYSFEKYSGNGYQVFEWSSGTLSNTGETLELINQDSQLIDIVIYGDGPEWGNCAPDGFGPSLELIDTDLDNQQSGSWRASYVNGGTPGAVNSQAPVTATWSGGTEGQESNWAVPSNWAGGQSAGPNTDVMIPDPVNDPLVVDNKFSCNQLVLEPGATLDIAPSDTLTVYQTLFLQSNQDLMASVVLGDGNSVLSVNGNSTIGLYLTGGTSRDPENAIYHFISSPVTAASAGNVFPGTAYIRSYNEPFQVWENLSSSSPLQVMNGYSVWLEGGNTMVAFSGTFNSGMQTITGMTYTGPGIPSYNPDYAGYNLIGNPYPSAVNWDHESVLKVNTNDAIYFWNPELEGYSSYVDGTGNNPETTGGIIPSMQGFFVRVTEPGASGSITFSNECRTHSTGQFYKQEGREINSMRISVIGDGREDQTSICFKQGSSQYFDPAFDAFKMWGSSSVPQLYSIAGDGSCLSINSLPSMDHDDAVMVGFIAENAGTYQLGFSGMETFPDETAILLEDLQEGILVDCRVNRQYQFSYEVGEDPERFLVHFSISSGTTEDDGSEARIFYSGGLISCYIPEYQGNACCSIIDLTGRVLRSVAFSAGGIEKIPPGGLHGCFIVRLSADQRIVTKKIFIP
jgi:hypothetical protein